MGRTTECLGCGEYIVWVRTEGEKWMPVDADTYEEGDELYDSDKHAPHWASCPNAKQFRRKG